MTVKFGKGKKSGWLVCDTAGCSAKSRSYRVTSPAAPDLSVCEQAEEKEGWSYTLGFFSMLSGHTTHCPDHK